MKIPLINILTINAFATGGLYLNPDKNFVIDNVSDTINLSTTINVKIGTFTSGYSAVFSHKHYFNNKEYAYSQSPTGITLINSATYRIWAVKSIDIWGNLNVSKNTNSSTLNTLTLIIPDGTISKDKITNLNASLVGLSADIGTLFSLGSNLSSDIATLNSNVSNLSGDMTTINSNVSNLSGDITTINSNV